MESWLQRKLANISLQELNFYTIIFILSFTLIFSSLLIYDEYQDFAKQEQVGIAVTANQTVLFEDLPKTRLIAVMVDIATLALILFGFIVGMSKIVNSMITRDMQRFLHFFESAHEKEICILPNDLYFSEFKKMAGYANAMSEMIHKQKASLCLLNANLEERVEQKTGALQLKNEVLKEEQLFSNTLLESHKQFIRYAIHETHTPLSVIMANIELFSINEGRNRYLAKIEAAVKNIFSIYDDLSYLVKKDQIEYPKKAIDLAEYVRQRLEFFDEVAHFSNLTFKYTADDFPAWIYFNETKLQRIIDNNITNAIKYTKKAQVIRVGVLSNIDACWFYIESKSQKIHDLEKIFEAYYRERKKRDGFGLGLNLVKSICDEEGVLIEISSSDEQTRFEYRFAKKESA